MAKKLPEPEVGWARISSERSWVMVSRGSSVFPGGPGVSQAGGPGPAKRRFRRLLTPLPSVCVGRCRSSVSRLHTASATPGTGRRAGRSGGQQSVFNGGGIRERQDLWEDGPPVIHRGQYTPWPSGAGWERTNGREQERVHGVGIDGLLAAQSPQLLLQLSVSGLGL